MKVTDVPAHIVVALAAMLTASVPVAFTVIVMALDVALVGNTQVPDGVITQVTTLPFASVVVVYVLPVPTGVVPTYH